MRENKNNKYCSLIEDLLPLYVENLVSEETKKEIEEHLKQCDKCSNLLKTMQQNGVFNLQEDEKEEVNTEIREKEIKCIKNIKKKIVLKVIISIVITCAVFLVAISLWNTYRIIQDEDGNWILYNFNTGNIKQGQDYTHILMEYTSYKENLKDVLNEENKETVEYQTILTFDKNDICVNARTIVSGYNDKELQDIYKWYIDNWGEFNTNVKIEDGKLYMNKNVYVGKTKEELISNAKDYNAKITEF